MSTEIIDFKTGSKLFEFAVRGFVVLSSDLHGTYIANFLIIVLRAEIISIFE